MKKCLAAILRTWLCIFVALSFLWPQPCYCKKSAKSERTKPKASHGQARKKVERTKTGRPRALIMRSSREMHPELIPDYERKFEGLAPKTH